MMKCDKETVDDILRDMREQCIDREHSPTLWPYLDRIETAHRREVAGGAGERKGILVANRSLAANNDRLRREVAELRECLGIIRNNLLTYTIKSADGKYVNNGGFLSEEFVDDERWRKALEGDER